MVVSGNVQGVGYRALVRDAARRLGIGGVVRNLQSGEVEIECEAKSPEHLAELQKEINVQGKGMLDINVSNIAVLNQDAIPKDMKPKFASFSIDFAVAPVSFAKGSALTFIAQQRQISAHAKKAADAYAERMREAKKARGPPKPQQTTYSAAMQPKKKEEK
jgi:acylphosphatase